MAVTIIDSIFSVDRYVVNAVSFRSLGLGTERIYGAIFEQLNDLPTFHNSTCHFIAKRIRKTMCKRWSEIVITIVMAKLCTKLPRYSWTQFDKRKHTVTDTATGTDGHCHCHWLPLTATVTATCSLSDSH